MICGALAAALGGRSAPISVNETAGFRARAPQNCRYQGSVLISLSAELWRGSVSCGYGELTRQLLPNRFTALAIAGATTPRLR